MDKKLVMFGPKSGKSVCLEKALFIDPGIGGTGYAFFDAIESKATKKTLRSPALTGAFIPPSNEQWDNKVWSLCSEFGGLVSSTEPSVIAIEFPELFSGSVVSHASAAKGDLFKLTFLIGGLAHVARELTGNLPVLMSPMEWKGQLPKQVVIERILAAWPELGTVADHEGDAIGMGLAAQGVL